MLRPLFSRALVGTLLLSSWSPGNAQGASPLLVRHLLPVEAAMKAASAAIVQCKAGGFEVAVAILDRDGTMRLLAASPAVIPISVEIAQRKARASVMFQTSSADFGARVHANPVFAASMQSVDPRLSGGAGALPISARGEFLGAIGVSGAAQGAQDEDCARAGLAAISDTLR